MADHDQEKYRQPSRILDLWRSKLTRPPEATHQPSSPTEKVLDAIHTLAGDIATRISEADSNRIDTSKIRFELRGETLREQHANLVSGDETRFLVSDLLVGAFRSAKEINEITGAPSILASLLISSQIPEDKKFIIREVAAFCNVKGEQDRELENAELLARHLLTLEKHLRAVSGRQLLADLGEVTKSPSAWAAVLDHIIATKVSSGNRYEVLRILRENYRVASSHGNEEMLDQMSDAGSPDKMIADYLRGHRDTWKEKSPPERKDDPFLDERL